MNWMNHFGIATARPVGLALLLSGCSDDVSSPNAQPDLTVTAAAELVTTIDSVDELRRLTAVEVAQAPKSPGGSCSPLPEGTIVTVDGAVLTWEQDPQTNCATSLQTLWVTEVEQSIVIQVLRGDNVVGLAQFDRMAPGMDARLVSPSDGIVRAGDEMVIVPPPELPTSSPFDVRFYPEGSEPWEPEGIRADQYPLRLADGIHAWVPAFKGRATVVLNSSSFRQSAIVSACDGLLACEAFADHWLGPFTVTEVP